MSTVNSLNYDLTSTCEATQPFAIKILTKSFTPVFFKSELQGKERNEMFGGVILFSPAAAKEETEKHDFLLPKT